MKNTRIKRRGTLIHPQTCEVEEITVPYVHIRGIRTYVLKCLYEDDKAKVHVVESDQIVLTKLNSVDKISTSMVFIYVDKNNPKKYVIEAFICDK